ncbi:MAG: hypothetical protein ABWZ79_06900 [Pedobacter agri]
MKKLYHLLLMLLLGNVVVAQHIYNISEDGSMSHGLQSAQASKITFHINSGISEKTFYIVTNGVRQNPNKNILGRDFPRDTTGNYTITILENHKIKECSSCLATIADTFKIEIMGKVLGPFNLKPLTTGQDRANVTQGENSSSVSTTQQPSGRDSDQDNSIINDAITISKLAKDTGHDAEIRVILSEKYGINTRDQNYFLKKALPGLWSDNTVQGTDNGTINPIGNSLSGISTTVLDGIVKFLIKRSKEELTIFFFKKFKEDIANYPDLKSVFPNTSILLNAIDEQIYNYSNYLNNLREAFLQDIAVLDDNLPSIIGNHPVFFKKDKNQKLAFALRSACYITGAIKDKIHPGDILGSFPTNYLDSITGSDHNKFRVLKGAIQSLQLFSESLKETDTTKHNYWVDIATIRKMVNDKKSLTIYIGLLLENSRINYDRIQFTSDDSPSFYMTVNTEPNANAFDKQYQNYKNYVLTLANKFQELNLMIKEYDMQATDSLKMERFSAYVKNSAQILQIAIKVKDLSVLSNIPGIANLETNSQIYFQVITNVSDLMAAINRKRYAQAINHLIATYDAIYDAPVNNIEISANKKLSRKEERELAKSLIQQSSQNPNMLLSDAITIGSGDSNQAKGSIGGKSTSALRKLTRYGAFMANMIDAKKSDEVAGAIESVALPAGSSSIKRETPFNVSLNAYLGIFTGSEVINGVDQDNPFKFNSFGVTAPIGILISRGNSILGFISTGKTAFSSSLFISLIDLGAIAAYRFQDSTTEQVPTIKIEDVFSPGLFYSQGIPKTPISVNFGVQTGPNLRRVTSTTNDYSKSTYIRYSVSICVDIPLLNLYTKSRN